MLRKLGIGFIALAAMTPGLAAALGVGEYQLDSYLNQPLDMKVKLYDAAGLSEDEIIVNLASQADYDAAGVNRGYFLNDLRFDVNLTDAEGAVLRIRSRQPVREPYLNFLVEFLWPTGRLMREYTVLLDPPSYRDEAGSVAPARAAASPEPVAATRSATPSSAPAPGTAGPERARAGAAASRGAESASAGPAPAADVPPAQSTYRVRASDTLWRIAAEHRASEGVSVQQTMVAIQEMNPDAFIDENVNLVREGAVLRLPTQQQARALSARQAIAEVASQNRQWRQKLARRAAAVPQRAPLDATGQEGSSGEGGAAEGQGRVTLVTPQATAGVADGDGTGASGDGDANTAALQNELAIRGENLDRLDRENNELSSRLSDTQAQVADSQRLIALRNEQIVALQQELRRLQEEQGVEVNPDLLMASPPAVAATAAVSTDEPVGTDDNNDAAAESPTVGADGKPSAAPDSVQASAPAADTAAVSAGTDTGAEPPAPATASTAPAPVASAASAGVVDWIMRNLLYVGALLAVLLLLLLLLIRRRRAGGGDVDDDDAFADDGFDDDAVPANTGPDFGAPPEEDLDDDQMDPMERADVYVAYGQYPQAMDYLRHEINQAPERGDLKIRLLELLQETENGPGFHRQAALFAGASVAVDAAIKRLGGDPNARATSVDDDLSLDDLELDLASDLSNDAPDDRSESDTALALDADDEPDLSDFEFSLDEEEEPPVALKDETPLRLDDLVLDMPDDQDPGDTLELDDADPQTRAAGEEDFLAFSDEELGALERETDNEDLPGEATPDKDNPFADLEMEELDVALNPVAERDAGAADTPAPVALDEGELELSLEDLDLDLDQTEPAGAPEVAAPALDNEDALDLGDLELQLDEPPLPEETPVPADGEDDAVVVPAAPLPTAAEKGDDMLTGDDDFDFLGETDENATKLDLARAYIDMGDADGARDILNEVLSEGSEAQQGEAKELLTRLS